MRTIIVFLIGFYQRYVSPHKGFRCAHAVRHSGASCSAAIKNIVLVHGIRRGAPMIRQRFAECRDSASALRAESEEEKKKRRRRDYGDDGDWACCMMESTTEACDGVDCSALDCSGADCSGAHCSLTRLWKWPRW